MGMDIGRPLVTKSHPQKLLTVRFTQDQFDALQALADEFAGGNLSAWVRYSALVHRPIETPKQELLAHAKAE